jgi:hypothetical protein
MEATMKKMLMTGALLVALVGGAIGAASSASALPTKTKKCSVCHAAKAAVKIKLTASAQTTDTATYKITVSGGKGVAGWAVFSGTKNIKRKKASSGTFTVARGATYKVYAVKKGTGSKVKTLVVP